MTDDVAEGRTPRGIYWRATGIGAPLVLLHGLFASGEMFAPLVGHLAGSYRLILPDLAGHGRSRDVRGPYRAADLAQDVVDILDANSVDQAAVMGYSQGGPVAIQLAHDRPDRVDSLILCCTYAHNTETVREQLEAVVFGNLIAVLGPTRTLNTLMKPGVGGGLPLTADQHRFFLDVVSHNSRRSALSGLQLMRTFDGRTMLGDITAPTLIICGSEDKAVPLHHAHMLRDGIPHTKLISVDGAGHPLLWTHTERLEALLRSWLSGASAR
jgi:pimeloyl-ACP methyl ester carboxylesterase